MKSDQQIESLGQVPEEEGIEVEMVSAAIEPETEVAAGGSRKALAVGILVLLILGAATYSDYRLWSQASDLRGRVREASGNFHALAEQAVDLPLLKEQLLAEIKAMDQRQQNAQSREQQLQTGLNSLRSSNESLTAQIESQKQNILALNSRLELLDGNIAKLANPAPQVSWQLAELDYWLQQAEQRLKWQQDVTTAIALLQQAEQALNQASLPAYKPLLDAITQDKAALQALPTLDRPAILQSLAGLVSRLDELPLKPRYQQPSEQQPTDNTALNSAWQVFSRDWLVIRKREPNSLPLRSPELLSYLKMNVALSLQLAQQAALQGNQALFERYLLQAETWLTEQIDLSPAEVSRWLAQLKSVRSMPVRLSLPDLAYSREQLALLAAGRMPVKEVTP